MQLEKLANNLGYFFHIGISVVLCPEISAKRRKKKVIYYRFSDIIVKKLAKSSMDLWEFENIFNDQTVAK